jgi:Tfp pilus assembly protein PilF
MAGALPIHAAMERAARLYGAGDLGSAKALCEDILRVDPRYFYALHLLAAVAEREGRHEDCVRLASRALQLDPNHVEALTNRGAALRGLNRPEEALADYDHVLSIAPRQAEALNNRGVALAALNRHAEAVASYDAALRIAPGYQRARFNRSVSRLVLGDFERGWADHESRWHGSDVQAGPRPGMKPQWTGAEDIRGKTVLLGTEQGLGDAIMFARYAPMVRDRGARVVLEVHPPLKELLAGIEGADQVIALGDPLPPHDFHVPIMSLALAFGTRLETIPARVPYIQPPPDHVERWRARLGDAPRPYVGLVWSGSVTLRNDLNRSIPLAALGSLRDARATLVSLQKEIRASDAPALAQGKPILDFSSAIADFRDTAALVSLMDVVITVDTSVAHLAGAMAKPVWLLLPYSPDWRWLLDRDDSPWYPTARLFRQPGIGQWAPAIARVAEALGRLAAQSR